MTAMRLRQYVDQFQISSLRPPSTAHPRTFELSFPPRCCYIHLSAPQFLNHQINKLMTNLSLSDVLLMLLTSVNYSNNMFKESGGRHIYIYNVSELLVVVNGTTLVFTNTRHTHAMESI